MNKVIKMKQMNLMSKSQIHLSKHLQKINHNNKMIKVLVKRLMKLRMKNKKNLTQSHKKNLTLSQIRIEKKFYLQTY